jgi:Na+-translocating ferredoxin:NAD+ oxidoreductase RnfD subunit
MADKKNQAGISLGILFGLMHTLWVAAVGAGIAQPIVNTLESGHFLSSSYSVTAFDSVTALTGITGAAITGYIIGWTFIYIYNFTDNKLDS